MKTHSLSHIFSEFTKRSGRTSKLIPVHFLFIVLGSLIEASPPIIIGIVVDNLINLKTGLLNSPWFLACIVVFTALYFILRFGRIYTGTIITETAGTSFQFELYRHLQKLSADFYQRTHVGEITSRLTNDINGGVRPFYSSIADAFGTLVFICAAGGFLLFSNWKLFLLFLVLGFFNYAYSNIFIPRIRKRFRDLRDTYGNVNAEIVEKVNAHSLIRAFAREKTIEAEVEKSIVGLRDKNFQTQRFMFSFFSVSIAFNLFISPLSLLIIGSLFLNKGITIGNLVTAFAYWNMFSSQLQGLVQNVTTLFTSLASFSRVLEFFEETPLVADESTARELQVTKGELHFENISFRYPLRNEKFSIDKVNLLCSPCTKTALVGHSGSGKSTLAQLLLRIYDTIDGRITIDGQDIAQVTQQSLRSQIGIVMQETLLLDGTFRSNLLFVKSTASEEEIISALSRAELWEFVKSSPEGLDTVVGEKGVRLSGGQRQRLAIARVFLLEPAIVILDEPTASLDAITEKSIMDTMDHLLENRTALIIAHRISTVINADQIIVLDHGKIVGTGIHSQLYETNEFYRNICIEQRVEKNCNYAK